MPLFRIIRLKFGRRFGCLWAISLSRNYSVKTRLALTPALSPRRGRSILYALKNSLHGDSFKRGQMVLPLPEGEGGHFSTATSHAQLDPEPRQLEELRNARVPIRSL